MVLKLKVMELHFRKTNCAAIEMNYKSFGSRSHHMFLYKLIYLLPAITYKNILLYSLPDYYIIDFSYFNSKEVSV